MICGIDNCDFNICCSNHREFLHEYHHLPKKEKP